MIVESIRELLDREPFVPFRLVSSSGKACDVADPHSAALLKSEADLFKELDVIQAQALGCVRGGSFGNIEGLRAR